MRLRGGYVRSSRERAGISALELAFELGVPPEDIDEMEEGKVELQRNCLAAYNAIQKLSRKLRGQASERPWVAEVTTQGITGKLGIN
ncbi:MAG: hypothetical protein HY318_13285 [Armatimonadetes bacterium]|nr:hypothetical protein [Armatimonadota bacterium]